MKFTWYEDTVAEGGSSDHVKWTDTFEDISSSTAKDVTLGAATHKKK